MACAKLGPRSRGTLTPADASRRTRPASGTPTHDTGGALLPARRLQPGARPRGGAPGEGGGAQGALLAGGREVPGPAAAGDAVVFFGMLPPMPTVTRHEFRGDVQNVALGHDPAHLQPLVHDQRRPASSPRAAPRASSSPRPTTSAASRCSSQDGKLTHTYSMMGVFVFRQQSDRAAADRRGDACAWSSPPTRRSPPPAARSRCSSTTSRSARAGWTTPCRCASPATPAWTSAATTAWRSIRELRRQGAVSVHRHRQEGRLRHQARTHEDEQTLHEAAQHGRRPPARRGEPGPTG